MIKDVSFKYFPDYLKWVRLADEPCDCPEQEPCLAGIRFEDSDVPDSVCLSDLISGKYRVDIIDRRKEDLQKSVRATYPDWSDEQVMAQVEQAVDELSRTPPIQWIQYNYWPACHGDFCRFIGEWSQEQLNEAAPDGDGLAYLISIWPEEYRRITAEPERIWRWIGDNWAVVYMFECLTCNQRIAIDQSF